MPVCGPSLGHVHVEGGTVMLHMLLALLSVVDMAGRPLDVLSCEDSFNHYNIRVAVVIIASHCFL